MISPASKGARGGRVTLILENTLCLFWVYPMLD